MSRNKRLFLLVDAMEVAALGLRVESGQVGQAVDGLERLTGAAERAERSTDGLSKGAESARKSSDRLGKSADASAKSVTNLAQMASRAGVMLGAALSVTLLKDYADSWSDMQSQVGAAVKNMGAAPALMQRIVDIANASYSPLQQTAAIYAQNVSVLEELGRSAQEAADFTESLNHMLVITATKGQQAEAVQGALSRAMAVGKLSGMGLETVLASGGRVAEALAKELGTTTNGLRAMAAQGKITSDVIANAIVNSLQDVRKEADEMPATIGDAFQRIQTNLTEFVGVLDQATGSSGAIAQGLIGVADAIRTTSKYASTFAALAAPAFDMVGSAVSAVAGYADMAVVALAGFYAPAMMGGLSLLTTSLGVGLVGALRAVAAAMLANPIGLLVGALVTAGYAVYKFRDQIHEAIGVDVVQTAKTAANYIIGSFVAAYEDLKFVFGNFGSIVGGAIVGGVNVAIRAVNGLIQGVTSRLDSFVESINETFGTGMKMIGGSAAIQEMVNPYADAVAAALEERGKKISEALSRDYLGELAAGFKKATLVIGGSTETIKNNSRSLVDNSKKLSEAAKAAKKFADERAAAFQRQREGISALQAERRLLEDQIKTFGMGKRAIEQLTISRLKEQAAVLAGFDGSKEAVELLRLEIEEREKLLQAGFTMDGLERGKKAAEELAEASKKTHDDIERSLTDALMRGFESGEGFGKNFIKTLKNMFATLVLRPIIQPIAAGAAGLVTGALGMGTANAQGAGGIDPITGLSTAKNLMGGLNWFTDFSDSMGNSLMDAGMYLQKFDGIVGDFGNTVLGNIDTIAGAANIAGAAWNYGKGIYDITKGNWGAGIGSIGGQLIGGPIGGMIGNALGGMLDGAFKGETRSGGRWTYDKSSGQSQFYEGPSGGYGGQATTDAMTQVMGSAVSMIDSVFEAVGVQAEVAAYRAMFESSDKGRGGTFSGGTILIDGHEVSFGTNVKGAGYGSRSASAEQSFEDMTKDMAFSALEAWQLAADQMPSIISDMLSGVDVRALSAEQADALAVQISGTVQQVSAFSQALSTLPFENLRALTFDLSATMLQAFGGIENAMAGLDTYYQNFYSETERAGHVIDSLTSAFSELGYELPANREAYRDLVESIDATTESGAQLYAQMIQMSGAFASVVESAEELTESASEFYRSVEDQARVYARHASAERRDVIAARRAAEQAERDAFDAAVKSYEDGAKAFDDLRQTLLSAGDAAGLLGATLERAFANPLGKYSYGDVDYDLPRWESGTTASGFNFEYGLMQMRIARQLSDGISANALQIENAGQALTELSPNIGEYSPVVGPIAQALTAAVVEASGDMGYAVRDSVYQSMLGVAQQDVYGQFASQGAGLASIRAAQQQAQWASQVSYTPGFGRHYGADVGAYAKALGLLTGRMQSGQITADQFDAAVAKLNETLPTAVELLGDTEAQLARIESAARAVAMAGAESITHYFGELRKMAAELEKTEEPINKATAAIGRMNSFAEAFGVSAHVAGDYSSRTGEASLIADAAGIAASVLTTADARKAAEALAKDAAFAGLGGAELRDMALLVDGIRAFDPDSWERSMIRMSDALGQGVIDEGQFAALFNYSLDVFEDTARTTQQLEQSFDRLRDAAGSLADELLLDRDLTTLSFGQQYGEAQRQYQEVMRRAMGGDADAAGDLDRVTRGFLERSADSRDEIQYRRDFAVAVNNLRQIETSNPMKEMTTEIKRLNQEVEGLRDDLRAANAAVASNTNDTTRELRRISATGIKVQA